MKQKIKSLQIIHLALCAGLLVASLPDRYFGRSRFPDPVCEAEFGIIGNIADTVHAIFMANRQQD